MIPTKPIHYSSEGKPMGKNAVSECTMFMAYNGYKVQVGQLQAGEIDFVCTKGTSRIYVQASYLIAGEETREREFGALKKIKDNYPKYVISMTPLVTRTDDDGIIHLSLREFLASGF